MENRRADGRRGEDAACAWLESKGYTIACRNYTVRGGEIDIVALDGTNTVFIEVKLRKSGSLQRPASAVTKEKQSRISAAAARYITENPGLPPRYDVIELTETGEGYKVRQIKGAFFGETTGERKYRARWRERYK